MKPSNMTYEEAAAVPVGGLEALHYLRQGNIQSGEKVLINIDYTEKDFTTTGEIYDFILDVVGKSSFSGSIRSLKGNGRYLIANPGLSQMVRGRWTRMTRGKKVMFGAANPKTEDLLFLKELIEAGKLETVIDRSYQLEQTAEAHRYVETGQKVGHVIITMEHNIKP